MKASTKATMKRAAFLFLLLLASPVAAQIVTGGGPKDSPPYNDELCAFYDDMGDSVGFVAWARPKRADYLAAQWRRISPDTTGWRPTLTAESWVDTNGAGVCMVPLGTSQDTAGTYEVRLMLADTGGATSSWVAQTLAVAAADSVVISSVEGALVSDSTVTIYGSGFGAKDPAEPLFYDDGSDEAYASLAHGALVPTVMVVPKDAGAPWYTCSSVAAGQTSQPRFVSRADSVRVVGRPCYRVWRKGYFGDEANSMGIGDTEQPLYISWWQAANHRLGMADDTHGQSAKTLRVWPSRDQTVWRLDANIYFGTSNGLTVTQNWAGSYANAATAGPTQGPWNHYDCRIEYLSGTAADSVLETVSTRINNKLQASRTTYSAEGRHDTIMLWGYDPNQYLEFMPTNSCIRFGEFYADTVKTRVIAGDASTWPEVRHWEIQPPTAWSSTEVSVTFNPGSFASAASAWLYVVTSAGVKNTLGFPIIIGSTIAPTPPTPNKIPGYQFNEYPGGGD